MTDPAVPAEGLEQKIEKSLVHEAQIAALLAAELLACVDTLIPICKELEAAVQAAAMRTVEVDFIPSPSQMGKLHLRILISDPDDLSRVRAAVDAFNTYIQTGKISYGRYVEVLVDISTKM